MDHVDNNHQFEADIRQYIDNNLSYQYPCNGKNFGADQFYQENINPNPSPTNNEHEQSENESMPIIYKKRVRTKFNQEQVFSFFLFFICFKNVI
jgi:hypothetical protein